MKLTIDIFRKLFFPKIAIIFVAILMCKTNGISQESADYFKQNCVSCHTIGGGRLTGPDLKNVSQRKDRAWLVKFLLDPKGMLDAGDTYALELQKESRGAIMPLVQGMNKARAEALLDLIETESKLEKSQFMGIQISDRPFTPKDKENGRNIFLGYTRLTNGGPPCISCHTTFGIGGFGGGTLGPELTTVFERYEGRKTLSTWLSAPATPTMQSVYKTHALEPEEVLSLVAYFQSTLERNPQDKSTSQLNFLLIGLGGSLILLGLFDVFWNNRFRAVRKILVQENKLTNV
ncbi:MAG: cytochrome c [Ignavibacteria bacterium]|nr:cytochrome c [Ignavibacteria bacterium]